ncbi:DsbA family protein [Roseovarius pacificus]|uniref:DsbA family protein n=1 Tax=Roseovarius pacificus TaxID=337701 RepID=UPI002A18D33C|nr:DsbA family protein [Roseovarius pacificus]
MILTRRNLIMASTGSLIMGAGAIAFWPQTGQAQKLTVDAVLNDPDAPVQGNPDGHVTLVEYFDYQCPFCKRMHPMLKDLVAEDGNVRLIMKDWPLFGAPSVRAAQLSLGAVSLGAYEEVHGALMATDARLSIEDVESTVGAIIDVDKADETYKAERDTWDGLLSRNDYQAVALGFRGTPGFAIEKTLYSGAQGCQTLVDAIAKARAES